METPRVDALHFRSGGDQPYKAMMELARQLERERDRLALMLEWLAERLEDIQLDDLDPTDYLLEEDDTWSMAWERGLEERIKPSAKAAESCGTERE